MAVGTASDYAALLKEYQAKQAGVKKWEDIFLQPYQTAAEQVSAQTQYDISGAFAQYKQSQLSAMQNTQLGSGFKEQIAADLASRYGSTYSQLRQQEATQLGELQTSYLQTLAQQEEALMEQGKQFATVEKALYDYMGITDTSLLEQSYGVDGGLGFYEMDETGTYNLTERGRLELSIALNDWYNATEEDKGQLFSHYLEEQDPELYDWYKQNYATVKQLLAGTEHGEDYSQTETRDKLSAMNMKDTFRVEHSELYNPNKTFESDKQQIQYYKALTSVSESNELDFDQTLRQYEKSIVSSNVSMNIHNTSMRRMDNRNYYTTHIDIDANTLTTEQKELLAIYGLTEHNGKYNLSVVEGTNKKIIYPNASRTSIQRKDFEKILANL